MLNFLRIILTEPHAELTELAENLKRKLTLEWGQYSIRTING